MKTSLKKSIRTALSTDKLTKEQRQLVVDQLDEELEYVDIPHMRICRQDVSCCDLSRDALEYLAEKVSEHLLDDLAYIIDRTTKELGLRYLNCDLYCVFDNGDKGRSVQVLGFLDGKYKTTYMDFSFGIEGDSLSDDEIKMMRQASKKTTIRKRGITDVAQYYQDASELPLTRVNKSTPIGLYVDYGLRE